MGSPLEGLTATNMFTRRGAFKIVSEIIAHRQALKSAGFRNDLQALINLTMFALQRTKDSKQSDLRHHLAERMLTAGVLLSYSANTESLASRSCLLLFLPFFFFIFQEKISVYKSQLSSKNLAKLTSK